MSEAIKKMGERFRMKREEMCLSLKEVENATSIRGSYLQAIEEGRILQAVSTVYALGFMRQYGHFLGWDQEKLSREFPDAFRIPIEKQDFAYGIGTLESRGHPQGSGRVSPQLIWGSLGLLLLLALWYFAKFVGVW